MAEAFLIMLHEGFEATLIVGIVFAYLGPHRPHRHRRGPVWLGVAAGVTGRDGRRAHRALRQTEIIMATPRLVELHDHRPRRRRRCSPG